MLAVPEPVAVAQLRAMAPTTFFEVGIAAHARAAREEMSLVLGEYRRRIAPGGVATLLLDQAQAILDGEQPGLPVGSRDQPLRWGGLAALGAMATAPIAAGWLAGRWRPSRPST